MSRPVGSGERATLLAALEANFAQYYLTYSRLPGGATHSEGELRWFSSGIPEPWFNGVLGERDGAAPAPPAIAPIRDHFAHLQLPFLWHRPPDSTVRAEAPLLAQGFRLFADEPGMALDLAMLPRGDSFPPGLTIERVEGPTALEEWTAVWMDGVPEPTRQRCRAAYHALGPAAGDYYLGRFAGVPVATVKLFYAAGVVSVQHVLTLPPARRRGIGGALVGHALRQARERGYRSAVLTSTPAGSGTYARLGFREVCRCKSFLWTPDTEVTGD
jgi:GNAT superfamily N-acetyltransferase